jgi:thiol-disulfide isomerase/thioredoxin
MKTFQEALVGAGLIPVETDVYVANNLLGVIDPRTFVQKRVAGEFPTTALRPWEQDLSLPKKNTLLYFWFPECENCRIGLTSLNRLFEDKKFPDNLQLVNVAFGTDATQLIVDEMNALKLSMKVYLDPSGGYAERLGVLAAPSVALLDTEGKVVARFNGELDFDSPGFDILLSKIAHSNDLLKNGQTLTLQDLLRTEVKAESVLPVTFLNLRVENWTALGLFVLVWYCIYRFMQRHRRVFKSSDNS